MSEQFYTHRFQGTGVNMQISVTAQAAQFILAKDVGDGPVEGLAITFDRDALDQLRMWLGMAAENTATSPRQDPLQEAEKAMASQRRLSDVEEEAKVR